MTIKLGTSSTIYFKIALTKIKIMNLSSPTRPPQVNSTTNNYASKPYPDQLFTKQIVHLWVIKRPDHYFQVHQREYWIIYINNFSLEAQIDQITWLKAQLINSNTIKSLEM